MEDTNKLYNIILDNWAQITVLLGVIGYIIKSVLNYKIRKREISFSKIQDNRLTQIKEYYSSFHNTKLNLNQLINQVQFGIHDEKVFNSIRQDIGKSFVELSFQGMVLKLYLDKEKIATIDSIEECLNSVRIDIENFLIYRNSEERNTYSEAFRNAKEIKLNKTLPKLIKEIELSVRSNYGVG